MRAPRRWREGERLRPSFWPIPRMPARVARVMRQPAHVTIQVKSQDSRPHPPLPIGSSAGRTGRRM